MIHRKTMYCIAGMALLLLFAVAISSIHETTITHHYPPATTTTKQPVKQPPFDIPSIATRINNERLKAGLPPLTEDARLDASSAAHCADMVRLNEWGHYLSDGTTPQTFMAQQFTHWQESGENTTYGWNTSAMVTGKLMASPEHKANVLNPSFTLVGYALCAAPSYRRIMVQEFVGF